MPTEHPAEFLRALLDASPFGIVALDLTGRIWLWSRGAQKVLGCSEIIGRPLRLAKNDGTAIDVETWTAAWREGTVAIVADNRRQRTTEREIQGLMERAEEALTQAQADGAGRILTLSAVTEQLLGHAREEPLGQPVERLVPEHVREWHTGHRAGYEAHPVTRPVGRRIRDVTERKRSEERLRAVRTKYTRALERNREDRTGARMAVSIDFPGRKGIGSMEI